VGFPSKGILRIGKASLSKGILRIGTILNSEEKWKSGEVEKKGVARA
jgi:hypothetical protein